MEHNQQLANNYNSLIEQVLTMLTSPTYNIYARSLAKLGLGEYPSDARNEYLLQCEIFVSILEQRRKLLVPILMGAARSRYSKAIENLNDDLKKRFDSGVNEQTLFFNSPFWGGVAELCLHVLSIEHNRPIVLLAPDDPLPTKLNLIAIVKLNKENQRLGLPERLLHGVDERYWMFVNRAYNNALDQSSVE